MATPPPPVAPQGSPTWSSSSGGATSSSESASPSRSSSPPTTPPAPTSSSAAPSSSSSPPHAAATPPSPPPGSGGGGTSSSAPAPSPSCAACRHQRRRCPPDCPLRPYFVADEPDEFRNALRVFGVKNLQRMLQAVPPPRRDVCVQTVVYESNVRVADPVRGCSGVIEDLESQLFDTAVELEVLRRRLESYRQTARGRGGAGDPPLAKQPQLPLMASASSDNMQTQAGPCGGAVLPPAAKEIAAATQPQSSSAVEMEPQSSQLQQQLSTMMPP